MMRKITLVLFLAVFAVSSVFAQGDTCADAIDISGIFGGDIEVFQISDMFDNTTATTGTDDPGAGWECFAESPDGMTAVPSLENTMWFTFTGDGNTYYINTGDCEGTANPYNNDTQFAIYSGDCASLTPEACNEDQPGTDLANGPWPAGTTFSTEDGQPYVLFLDGWNGTVGQFCINAAQINTVSCNDITAGMSTATPNVCFGDTLFTAIPEIPVIPITNNNNGFLWIITTEAPTGEIDPEMNPGYLGTFGIQENPYIVNFIHDGTQVPVGSYFLTAVTFGDITLNDDDTINWASGCVAYGDPLPFELLDELPALSVDSDLDVAGMQITLSISGGSGAYTVEWADGSSDEVYSYPAPDTYEVSVTDDSGCLGTETLVIDAFPIGIQDLADLNVSIFPNPANDVLNVNWANTNASFESYSVMNLMGQRISAGNVGANQQNLKLEMSTYAVGQYFLILQSTDGEVMQSRFTVDR